MAWTTPRTFSDGDDLMPYDLNAIEENLEHLYYREKVAISRLITPATYAITGTTWAAVTNMVIGSYRMPMGEGDYYLVSYHVPFSTISVANRYCFFDVQFTADSTGVVTYLSSGTTTPASSGVYATSNVGSDAMSICFTLLYTSPATDTYKVNVVAKMSGTGTCTLRCDIGLPQLFVMEVGSGYGEVFAI
jgi:hypothetical protein